MQIKYKKKGLFGPIKIVLDTEKHLKELLSYDTDPNHREGVATIKTNPAEQVALIVKLHSLEAQLIECQEKPQKGKQNG